MVTHHYPRGPNLFAGLGSGERQGTGTVEANRRVNPVFVDPSGHRRLLVRGSAGVLAVAGVAFIAGTGLLLANQPATSASGDVGSNSAPVGLAPGAAQSAAAAGRRRGGEAVAGCRPELGAADRHTRERPSPVRVGGR